MKIFIYLLLLSLILSGLSCSEGEKEKAGQLELMSRLLQKEDIKKADSLFRTVIYNPGIDHDYKLIQIVLDFKKGSYSRALEESNDFIAKYPVSSFGYYYAGLSEFNMQNYSSAGSFFDQSFDQFKKTPGDRFIYFEKNQGDYLFDQNSIYDDLVFMLGLSKNSLGHHKTAIRYMENCLSKNYRKGEALVVIGDCYLRMGEKVAAKAYFLQAKGEGNSDADFYLQKYY